MLVAVVLCFGEAQVRNLGSVDPELFPECVVVVTNENVRPAFHCAVVAPAAVDGFNAGANRDKGLQAASEMWPGCDVVFLDGDCTPGPTWAREHISALSVGAPVVSCGARTQGPHQDPRALPLEWQGRSFEPSMTSAPREPALSEIVAHRATWSCNLGINRAALHLLQDAGETLHGSRRIFAPEFDGRWGGEDTGLGIVAHHVGCTIRTISAASVEHIPHDPFRISRINLDRIPAYAERVRGTLKGNQMPFKIRITPPSVDGFNQAITDVQTPTGTQITIVGDDEPASTAMRIECTNAYNQQESRIHNVSIL